MLEMAGSASNTVVQWGKAQVGTSSSYESMCFKGEWYNLYDNVFCRSGRTKPYVGKLMRLYEEEGVQKVRIRWFFRPEELPLFVRKDFPSDTLQSKELFIGLGSGIGVENKNVVEVICGKANILCTARIKENPLPSSEHIEIAHHFFNRAYDVGKKKLVKIGNILNKPLAEKICNKHEWMLPIVKAHPNDEESCEAIDESIEQNISSTLGFLNAKEEKKDLLHPIERAQGVVDDDNLSTSSLGKEDLESDDNLSTSSLEKEDLESVVSVTSSGGKKRILLKTPTTALIVPLRKRKICT